MKTHKIRLTGPRASGACLSALAMRDLLDALLTSARHAVRLRAEGRGLAGTPPGWLDRVSDLVFMGLEAGSTLAVIDAPTLAEAAPDRFSQADFFSTLDPGETVIEILEESLGDALAGDLSSERFDSGLVRTFTSFGRLFRYGIDTMDIDGGRRVHIDAPAVARLETLQRQIPADQRVILVGKIEMLHHSKRMFTVRVDDGKEVRGVVVNEAVASEDLGRLFGQRARVSGLAKFRPSGEALLIEADGIESDDAAGGLLSRAPKALFQALDMRGLHRPQGARSGVAAVMGRWPGDESDEEVEALLAELS
jgi:hypothetical protein